MNTSLPESPGRNPELGEHSYNSTNDRSHNGATPMEPAEKKKTYPLELSENMPIKEWGELFMERH